MPTKKSPIGNIQDFKRIKILATIGPATNSSEKIEALIDNGANGIRLNFSHGSHEERAQQIKWIRQASKKLSKPVAIVMDVQGPKIRLGDFEGFFEVKAESEFTLEYNADFDPELSVLPIQFDLSKKVKPGERLLLADGSIQTTIQSVKGKRISVKPLGNGKLSQRKGINLPDTDFGGDIITKKDWRDIEFGLKNDVDYIALSFVQSAKDVEILRSWLEQQKSEVKVIAKIETEVATHNLEEITKAAHAVMVARGDLAIETTPENVPIVQRKIIELARTYNGISIVATQMLASMVDNLQPTRAEVSDVATAVMLGADCLMLSEETANGNYPVESVAMMKRIIKRTQAEIPPETTLSRPGSSGQRDAISSAIVTLAHQIEATAVVAETRSGATAVHIATHRPNMPLIMVTNSDRVANQLALVFGGKSFKRPVSKRAATKLTNWLKAEGLLKSGDIIVTASGQQPGVTGQTDTIKVRVLE